MVIVVGEVGLLWCGMFDVIVVVCDVDGNLCDLSWVFDVDIDIMLVVVNIDDGCSVICYLIVYVLV